MKKGKGTKVALVSKFTLIIGVSVFITVLFISAYNLSAAAPILKRLKLIKINNFPQFQIFCTVLQILILKQEVISVILINWQKILLKTIWFYMQH